MKSDGFLCVLSWKAEKVWYTLFFLKHVFCSQHAKFLLKNLVYAVVKSQAENFTDCFIHGFSELFCSRFEKVHLPFLRCNIVELYFMGFITFLQSQKVYDRIHFEDLF